ncbi:MAG: SGNH/GDSL hydrolase family protein [Chitinophagales bacterium]
MKTVRAYLGPLALTALLLVLLEGWTAWMLKKNYDRSYDVSIVQPRRYGATDGLKPNACGTVFGKTLCTDSWGGRRLTPGKQRRKKFIFIGDSVTEGIGVADSATFTQYINLHTDAEVHAIAMAGWSSADYVNVMKNATWPIDNADTVTLIWCWCLNDIYGKHTQSSLPIQGKEDWLHRTGRFLQKNCHLYQWLKLLVFQHADAYYTYDAAFYQNKAYVVEAQKDIQQAAEWCAAHGYQFALALLPYRSQLKHQQHNPQQQMMTVAQLLHVPVINLLDYWPKQEDAARCFLWADEIHFSPEGHQTAGAILAKESLLLSKEK